MHFNKDIKTATMLFNAFREESEVNVLQNIQEGTFYCAVMYVCNLHACTYLEGACVKIEIVGSVTSLMSFVILLAYISFLIVVCFLIMGAQDLPSCDRRIAWPRHLCS